MVQTMILHKLRRSLVLPRLPEESMIQRSEVQQTDQYREPKDWGPNECTLGNKHTKKLILPHHKIYMHVLER